MGVFEDNPDDPFHHDPFFRASKREFEELKRDMMTESRKFWRHAEEEMRRMREEFETRFVSKATSSSLTEDVKTSPPVKMWGETEEKDCKNQVIRLVNTDTKFEVSLDVRGFNPDELKVKVSGFTLSVEGNHRELLESRKVTRQFTWSHSLPDTCEPDSVVSNLDHEGVLVITAPKRKSLIGKEFINVPIAYK